MSDLAVKERERRRRSMLPGGPRDAFVSVAKWAFPLASGTLLAVLVALPMFSSQEFSFLLSKDSAAKAEERMRTEEARYVGDTNAGEQFEIVAESGVQKSSNVPILVLKGLSARVEQATGPATLTAPGGEFLLDENRLIVNGPVVAKTTNGYTLDGDRIEVDINGDKVFSEKPVSGKIPMGHFRSDSFSADIKGETVSLVGKVSLRITPKR